MAMAGMSRMMTESRIPAVLILTGVAVAAAAGLALLRDTTAERIRRQWAPYFERYGYAEENANVAIA